MIILIVTFKLLVMSWVIQKKEVLMRKWNLSVMLSLLLFASFGFAKMTVQNKVAGKKVDILFIIDNSASMSLFQAELLGNLNVLTSGLPQQGIDFHIGVATTDSFKGPNGSSNLRLRDGVQDKHSGVFVVTPETADFAVALAINLNQGVSGGGVESPFLSFKQVLDFPQNNDFRRADAELAVVTIGDEDDSSTTRDGWMIPTTDFSAYLKNIGDKNKASFSAITILDRNCPNDNRSISSPRMSELVKLTEGYQSNICEMKASLEGLVQFLAIPPAASEYFIKLDHTPVVETIVVKINGHLIKQESANGWTYDSSSNQLILRGTAIPAKGDLVSVSYDYQE
jgi:hypothetical protein